MYGHYLQEAVRIIQWPDGSHYLMLKIGNEDVVVAVEASGRTLGQMLKPLVKSISKERKDREVKYIIPENKAMATEVPE